VNNSAAVLSPVLVIVCAGIAVAAAIMYRLTGLGSAWTVPVAAARAAIQLAAVAAVLAAAMARLWSSILVLAVVFVVATVTAARPSQASHGSLWLAAWLAVGLIAVLLPLMLTGAVVPVVGIVLGGTMTAVAVAARRSLDTLSLRAGEVDAALSLGCPNVIRECWSSTGHWLMPCCPTLTRPAPPALSLCRVGSWAYYYAPVPRRRPLRSR
jgi:putative ABC transport system permease protein